jgi:hypothetical protein
MGAVAGRLSDAEHAQVADLIVNIRQVPRHTGHSLERRANGGFRRPLSFNLRT